MLDPLSPPPKACRVKYVAPYVYAKMKNQHKIPDCRALTRLEWEALLQVLPAVMPLEIADRAMDLRVLEVTPGEVFLEGYNGTGSRLIPHTRNIESVIFHLFGREYKVHISEYFVPILIHPVVKTPPMSEADLAESRAAFEAIREQYPWLRKGAPDVPEPLSHFDRLRQLL